MGKHQLHTDANDNYAGRMRVRPLIHGTMMMSDIVPTNTFLTPGEAAKLLMLSPITLRQYAQNNQILAETTPGGHRRYHLAALFKFARDNGITLTLLENYARTNGIKMSLVQDSASRILIADDDRHLTNYLVELFANQEHEIICEIAHDGFEVGQKMATFNPHTVLLDLMMPGIDGFNVCERLRNNPDTANVHIIAMTGYYTEENVEKILKAGANHCLSKPFDTKSLLDAIGVPLKNTLSSNDPGY